MALVIKTGKAGQSKKRKADGINRDSDSFIVSIIPFAVLKAQIFNESVFPQHI